MRSSLIRSRVGADGSCDLDVRSDLAETDVEVIVILQPVRQSDLGRAKETRLATGFFECVVGGWQGERLTRECEGEYEPERRISTCQKSELKSSRPLIWR